MSSGPQESGEFWRFYVRYGPAMEPVSYLDGFESESKARQEGQILANQLQRVIFIRRVRTDPVFGVFDVELGRVTLLRESIEIAPTVGV